MPVIKNEYPILEYDTELNAVAMPDRAKRARLPRYGLVTFFSEVLDEYLAKVNARHINTYKSEMRHFPIYVVEQGGIEFCLVQAAVGSASIAMMADYLIGYGVEVIIACGGCGVLTEIPAGDVILPVAALWDEGASYHYLPPSREIALDAEIIAVIKDVLVAYSTPFIECKTWTTDAFYRETPDMITYRKEEGCSVVEMECATMAAVARFRSARFGQLLYSGDILTDFEHYDERDWSKNLTARQKLFHLSLAVIGELAKCEGTNDADG